MIPRLSDSKVVLSLKISFQQTFMSLKNPYLLCYRNATLERLVVHKPSISQIETTLAKYQVYYTTLCILFWVSLAV